MRNEFKVPKKQWNKWSSLQRRVFNSVASAAQAPVVGWDLIPSATARQRRIIAFNVAWQAASTLKLNVSLALKRVKL